MFTSLTTKLRHLVSLDKDTNTNTTKKQTLKRNFQGEDLEYDFSFAKRPKTSDKVIDAIKVPFCKLSEWVIKMKPSFADLYYYRQHSSKVKPLNQVSFPSTSSNSFSNKVSIEYEPAPSRVKVREKLTTIHNKVTQNVYKGIATRSELNSFRKDESSSEFKRPAVYVRQPLRIPETQNKDHGKKSLLHAVYSDSALSSLSIKPIVKSPSTTSLSSVDSSGSHSLQKINVKNDTSFCSMYDKTYSNHHLPTSYNSQMSPSCYKNRKTPLNAVQACILLEEKERYRELLQQFTSAALPSEEVFTPNTRIHDSSQWSSSSGESSASVTVLGNRIPKREVIIKEKLVPRKMCPKTVVTKEIIDLAKIENKKYRSSEAIYPWVTPPSSDTEAGNTPSHDDKDSDILILGNSKPCVSRSVSTFEKVFNGSPYFSEDWITEMKSKFEASARVRRREIEEEEIKTKILKEQREAQNSSLEKQIRERLRIALLDPAVIEDDVSEEDLEEEYPELTPEMEEVIEEALHPYPPNEVLVEGYKQQITRKDLETLSGLNWLNDEIINFYMNMLMERGQNDNFPTVHAFNTFFYPKLISGGHDALKRWTRRIDIFSFDKILVPVHLSMHWCMAIIDFRKKCINYYDSMGGKNQECLNALKEYLHAESKDKKKNSFDWEGWRSITIKDIPHQMNGSDCGMFACKYAEYATRDSRISFTQEQMPYFRRRMVYEIMTKNLL